MADAIATELKRVRELVMESQNQIYRRTDRLFAGLLIFEWLAAVVLAIWVTPYTWSGAESRIHPHVWIATFLGLAVISLPVAFTFLLPGRAVTRHTVAIAQLLMSALFIHLTGGRIETHFHVFGSLAFLSLYRDWRVLITASAVTASDHILRGVYWPESAYGVAIISNWRWMEHTSWVVFIDLFLVYACLLGQQDLRKTAEREAALEASYATVEEQVDLRTRELGFEVTERRRVETQLRETAIALESAVRAAESASRTKSEFLANMSHEIRTPMNGILGMTALVLETDLSADQRVSLNLVKSSADSLLTIINDILDFSKIEAGKLDLDPIPFILSEAVGDILKSFSLPAHEKGLELACDICPEVPDVVRGDVNRIRQILTNLVGNAIKFTEHGEVVLRVERLSWDGFRSRCRFTVTDTGIGIPESNLTRIFDPFTQADGSTTRKYGGTGLGLSISARLVELMGGRIWAESEPGRGSRFMFEIELEKARGSIERRIKIPVKHHGLPILIVDDNATNRRVLAETVRLWEAVPTCAESGEAGLAELRRAAVAGTPYRLILLDAMMPGMDGFMMAEQIRREPALAEVTILLLTSSDRKGEAARCRDLGFASYLVKPVKPSELNLAIAEAMISAPRPHRPMADAPNPRQVQSATTPLRVLLAEDNAINQRVAVRLIEKFGHTVEVVWDGAEAVSAWDRQHYDVIFMDVQMPVMDGFEATRVIREKEERTGRRTFIVALTAHALKGDRERCLAAGMDEYISKPVQQASLFDILTSAAKRKSDESLLPADTPTTSPGFDRAEAVQRLGGDEDLYEEVTSLFLKDSSRLITEIRSAIEIQDASALRRIAHGLKGAAGYIGGRNVANAAHRLELMGDGRDLTEASSVFAELLREMDALTQAVSKSSKQVMA